MGLIDGTSVLLLQAARKRLQRFSRKRVETTQRTMRAGFVVRALSGAERRPILQSCSDTDLLYNCGRSHLAGLRLCYSSCNNIYITGELGGLFN